METLQIGQYKIPDGTKVKLHNGIIKIWHPRTRIPYTGNRCRDCKYLGNGHANNNRFTTTICTKKPKTFWGTLLKGIDKLYYATLQNRPACDMFKPKE